MKVNGWTYDPAAQAWTAKTGPSTWSIVKGDLDDPPPGTRRPGHDRPSQV